MAYANYNDFLMRSTTFCNEKVVSVLINSRKKDLPVKAYFAWNDMDTNHIRLQRYQSELLEVSGLRSIRFYRSYLEDGTGRLNMSLPNHSKSEDGWVCNQVAMEESSLEILLVHTKEFYKQAILRGKKCSLTNSRRLLRDAENPLELLSIPRTEFWL